MKTFGLNKRLSEMTPEQQEVIREYRRNYYLNNKEKFVEGHKRFYEKRDQKAYQKERYKAYAVNVQCECGDILKRPSLKLHLTSRKHALLLENLQKHPN